MRPDISVDHGPGHSWCCCQKWTRICSWGANMQGVFWRLSHGGDRDEGRPSRLVGLRVN